MPRLSARMSSELEIQASEHAPFGLPVATRRNGVLRLDESVERREVEL